jgi:hypothetical protein
MVDATRAMFDGSASASDFRTVAQRLRLQVLQCVAPVPDDTWAMINELVCVPRPEVQLRVYGHYGSVCDLHFARLLTNARHFAADCLRRATRLETLEALTSLQSLSLGVFELSDFSVLDRIPEGLSSLSLGPTQSKKPGLFPLARFHSLRRFYVDGHSKDIAVLSGLSGLEDVTLRSITTPDLTYLEPLSRVWSLDIKLGGIRCFKGIEGKDSIKYLEMWQIRNLRDIQAVSTLPGLQCLFLQSLPNVVSFPRLQGATSLRRVVITNLKGLRDFTAFATAPALEEFALSEGSKQTPEQLLPVLANPRVRRAGAWLGSDRKNKEWERLRDQHGKAPWPGQFEPFQYR